jgi:PhnB protein
MTQINAYLTLNGNCREAMTFYNECLEGELTMQTVEDSPIASQMPAHTLKQILHASLVKDGLVIMASEMSREKPVNGNTISLCLQCSSEDEIQNFFSKLSSGGKIIDPLKEQFWGSKYGELRDKFGITWLLNYDKNQK